MQGCRPLTRDEQDLLLSKLPTERDRVLFLLLLYTGFRISEALSLNVGDVAGQDRVTVQRRHMKTKSRSRTVLLHPELKQTLEAWLLTRANAADSEPLFLSRFGRRLERTSAWRALDKAVVESRLQGRVAFHSARKTFAKSVHSHFKHDIVKTSKALGHTSILTTVAYLSFEEQEMDEAVLSLGRQDNHPA